MLVVGLLVASACVSTVKQPRTAHLSRDPAVVRKGLSSGRMWRLVEVDGRPATGYLIFRPDGYTVSAGCNSIFGGYELAGNLVVSKMSVSTLMECGGGLGARAIHPDFVVGGRYRVLLGASELVLLAEGRARSRWARYVVLPPEQWRRFGRELGN